MHVGGWGRGLVVGGGGGWSVRLAFREQKNVAPFSVIPQERASLEGMVQQKLGHCGCSMPGSNLVEAVVCCRGVGGGV